LPRKVKVVGFDIKPERIEMMKNKIDPATNYPEEFEGCDILFTSNPEDLRNCHFHLFSSYSNDEHNFGSDTGYQSI
jgi:UDP-N-acetyl-D-galactosamine dehydrogenase